MLQTIIKKNSYQDSVVLMLLTSKINQLEEVERVSIMMGTPANKDIFAASGFETPELKDASANDMVIILEMNNEDKKDEVLAEIEELLLGQGEEGEQKEEKINSWKKALAKEPNASMAVFSIPGNYVALEVEKALDYGLHAFVFSDNVAVEDEKRLKEKAHEKGLIVMGPDCGTGMIKSLPIAFTNNIRPGNIGIVGASGTGIQEVSTLIHRYGGGVTNAIGTGGRDLSSEVGAVSMLDGIAALNDDPDTETIVVISKPPAKEIEEKVMNALRSSKKPAVTIFLGENPTYHESALYHAYTLEEAAQLATKIQQGKEVDYQPAVPLATGISLKENQTGIRGFYAGGTLAYETAMLLEDALELTDTTHEEGYMLQTDEHEVIDLGDDMYTQGKPHPMIDPENRIKKIRSVVEDETIAAVLFDIVLGYGAHKNMAAELATAINEVQEELAALDRQVAFIGTIVGTDLDIQGLEKQKQILADVNVIVCENNTQAVQTALQLIGKKVNFSAKEVIAKKPVSDGFKLAEPSEQMKKLLTEKPVVINVGLNSFTESVVENNGTVVQYDWAPVAGGNIEMQKVLHFLDTYQF
ncbi:acyl-CoA synthetase FdrA [Enterococcus sp. LJL99]